MYVCKCICSSFCRVCVFRVARVGYKFRTGLTVVSSAVFRVGYKFRTVRAEVSGTATNFVQNLQKFRVRYYVSQIPINDLNH